MRLLLPLGLLGLAGIIALIIIYIIKPNYQQKLVSSTFIWRLSLKYKKRKIPLSKLRNIILIACQVLIITTITLILAKTVFVLEEKTDQPEVILIIDSSASMRAGDEASSRYERAVRAAVKQAQETFDADGLVSVILAEKENAFLTERAAASSRTSVIDGLNALIAEETQCSYSTSDMNAAMILTDRVLSLNPAAKIYLYTDTTYASLSKNITLVNVAQKTEWNAAILNATASFEDNYYTFRIDLACYGRDMDITLDLEIFGINAADSEDTSTGNLKLTQTVSCIADQVNTVIFKYVPGEDLGEFEETLPENATFYNLSTDERAYSYQSVHITIDVEDSVSLDNSFDIYGGLKQVIRVQYYSDGTDPGTGASLAPNVFFQEAFAALKKVYAGKWDIQITEIKKGGSYATEGFDFYIFEHTMPNKIPTDGVVLLADPTTTLPSGIGLTLEKIMDMSKKSVYLAEETSHPILNNLDPTNISVSRYDKIKYGPEYTMLLSYAGDPMLLVRNDETTRMAVMCFSLHYSNLPLLIDFPLMMYNMFEYFLPSTVNGNAFEAEDTINVNSRGSSLNVTGYNTDLTFTEFPAKLKLDLPGSYQISQTTFAGKSVTETIYVRMPMAESNVFAEEGALESPKYEIDESDYYRDLLLYLAAALVALILIEWFLQHKESSI